MIEFGSKKLLITSDIILATEIQNEFGLNNFQIVLDKSPQLLRTIKLIFRRKLTVGQVLKIYMCRNRMKKKSVDYSSKLTVTNQYELLDIVENFKPELLVAIQCSMIFNVSRFPTKLKMLNIHGASLPQYGGLGALFRAIADESYNQECVLHLLTNDIDKGKTLASIKYYLDPNLSYCQNYERSIIAGKKLIEELCNGDLI
jgi:methionyl-tRNA formyltransferase